MYTCHHQQNERSLGSDRSNILKRRMSVYFDLLWLYTACVCVLQTNQNTLALVEAARERPHYGLSPTLINWQAHTDPAAPQFWTTRLHSNREKHHVFIISRVFFASKWLTLRLTVLSLHNTTSQHFSPCVLIWPLFITHPCVYLTNHTYVHNSSVSNTMCKL